MNTLKLSVHQLVDFLLRSGDIDNRIFNRDTMNEGSRIHALYQRRQGANYLSEYNLKYTSSVNDISVTVEGRADGIIITKEGYIIDEIKSCNTDIDNFYANNEAWHLGQAKVYAYMFAKERNLTSMGVRLTYISQINKDDKKIYNYQFNVFELEQYYVDLILAYLSFFRLVEQRQSMRDEAIENLSFPHNNYRKGQKQFMKMVFDTINHHEMAFIEAPTGIGKTVSALYPALKALKGSSEGKIFYLTAKNSGKESAFKTMRLLNKDNCISYINITSKEKICFNDKRRCNPDECRYAKGYYAKIGSILTLVLAQYREINYDLIIDIAHQYEVCPYELELDLSLLCDVIIADYNYLFDPISYMMRYFSEDSPNKHIALIDEAHNLVSRSREMYSERLDEAHFILARDSIKKTSLKSLRTTLNKIAKYFSTLKGELVEGNNIVESFDSELIILLEKFVTLMQSITKNDSKQLSDELIDFNIEVVRFLKIYELSNKSHIYYIEKNKYLSFRIYCLDASKYLRESNEKLKSSLFYSATLSPLSYYIDTLGGDRQLSNQLSLPSPFHREQLKIIIAPKISVKYKNREKSYGDIADYINAFVEAKMGNYLLYCPSYEYLNNIQTYLKFDEDVELIVQKKEMSDIEKSDFLLSFKSNPTHTTIGLCVIGGSFSEGVDLINDRLIGVIIIGVGLAKTNFDNDQIASYYSEQDINGYDYSYLYPALNKIMQAIGRVIRDENDQGAALLLDERYCYGKYRDLVIGDKYRYEIAYGKEDVKDIMTSFYK